MKDKYKYLIKNVGILTISNFASKILVFLLVPLYTSVLSTEEYGIYDMAITTTQLLFPIITVNIVDGVMRFIMDKNYERKKVVNVGFAYILGGVIIATVLIFIATAIDVLGNFKGYEILILLYYISYTMNQYLIQLSKGLEKITDMGIAGALGTVVMIVGNLLFLLVFQSGLKGFFVANILAQAVPTIYLFIRVKLWKYISFKVDKTIRTEMVKYSAPLIFTVVGWWINSAADRYVVAFIIGMAANGILSVAYKIPSIINTLQSIFVQAWQVSAIKEYENSDKVVFYSDSFIILNFLMCIACSILIILSRPLAEILYAKDFFSAWKYVPFLLIASVLNSASGFLGPILAAKKDSKSMAVSAIYGSVFNIVFNIILVYLIGIQGATITTVISSFIIFLIRRKAVARALFISKEWTVYLVWGLLIIQAIAEIKENYYIQLIMIVAIIALNKDIFKKSMSILKKRGRMNNEDSSNNANKIE